MQLYTTPEAAKETGIPESTIRSWLRRHPGVFLIDTHIIIDENGVKLWTAAGIELLKSRTAPKNAPSDNAEISADNFLELLLDNDSEQLAREYWRQLPGRVLHRIRQMQNNPSPEDNELIRLSIGSAITSGTSHLILPRYEPILLGEGDETD